MHTEFSFIVHSVVTPIGMEQMAFIVSPEIPELRTAWGQMGLCDRCHICFPFNTTNGRVVFWIDKEKKRFFTVGAEPEPEEVLELAEALESQLNVGYGEDKEPSVLLESGTEETTTTIGSEGDDETSWTAKTIVIEQSNSVLRKVREVRRSLDTSAEAEILVKGKNGHWDAILSTVAAERHPQMVYLFLRRGAQVNSRNHTGRTPLMEAALWGRFENTRILLERGADKEGEDKKGRKAIELASQSRRNAEERHVRAGGLYKEETFDTDK